MPEPVPRPRLRAGRRPHLRRAAVRLHHLLLRAQKTTQASATFSPSLLLDEAGFRLSLVQSRLDLFFLPYIAS